MTEEVITSDMIILEIRNELAELFLLVQRTSEFVSEANTRFPQFFMQVLTVNNTQTTFNFNNLNYFINIIYRDRANPSVNTTNLQNALNRMAFDLTNQFNDIRWFKRRIPLINKRYEVIDNIVHFFCEFNVGIQLEEMEYIKQQVLKINQELS